MAVLSLRHQSFCVCAISLALQITLHAQGQLRQPASQSSQWRRQVFAAWEERNVAIKSYSMRAEIEETVVGRGERPPDPPGLFNDTLPKADHVAKVRIEYAYEHGKAALKRFSDGVINPSDPERPQTQTLLAAFDGTLNAEFMQSGASPLVFCGMSISAEPGPMLAVNSDLIPTLLWRQPVRVIEDIGWQVHAMFPEESAVEVNSVECRRIRIPRSGRRWTSALDVDAGRGWLPIQWQGWLDGKLQFRWTMEYGRDNDFGPAVIAWQHLSYTEAGDLRQSRTGNITEYKINSDVDDNRFTVDFPLGAHVVEKDGDERRYFIQTTEGLQPMDEHKYGRVDALNRAKLPTRDSRNAESP